MRSTIRKPISLVLIFLSLMPMVGKGQTRDNMEGRITLSGAFALYPMAVVWANEFRKLHPKVKIDISAGGAGKGITDALSGMVDIGMVSRDINPLEIQKGAYTIAVTRDAVVPTFSAANPSVKDIQKHGIRQSTFKEIWVTGKVKTWGQVLGNKQTTPLRLFSRSDACGAAESWAKYLGSKQEDLFGTGVFGDPGVSQAVIKEPFSLGYNNIAYVYDSKTKKPYPGILVIPIDVNNNGIIDKDEDVYSTLDAFLKAVSSGKYPSPPARDLYFVTKGKTKNKLVTEFIHWVLTDGQKYVSATGYIALSAVNLSNELKKIK